MGSWAEWGHVLTDAAYSGGLFFIILWGMNRGVEDDPHRNLLSIIAAVYFGVASGLSSTFHSRIWHWPLSIVSTVILVSYLVVAFAFRRQVAANWRRDWKVWRPRLERLLPRSG
jgi:hypothetical protein